MPPLEKLWDIDTRPTLVVGGLAVFCLAFAITGIAYFPPELLELAFVAIAAVVALVGGLFHDEIREQATIRLGRKKSHVDHLEQGLRAIQEADPRFNLEDFCSQAVHALFKMNRAVDEGQFDRVRTFISDGIYQRLVFAQQEEETLGRQRVTTRLTVTQVVPVEILSAKNQQNAFEVITLRMTGTATRSYRLRDSGAGVETEREESIAEVWTFLRRRGAQTKTKDFGLIEGNCPNCGTDVTVNQWEKCPSCESTLRSGEHDWVLSKISDQSAWRSQRPFKMSSATRYWIKRDPGFSTHYLEDRSSVIFFRKFLADRLGVVDPLGKVATDRFCEAYERRLLRNEDGTRTVYFEPKILAADVCGVIAEEPQDQALMHIRWTARRGRVGNGGVPVLEPSPVQMGTMMVLVRSHGAKTRIERTITSSHCPKCGAPESNRASHACEFCGTILNNGALEWVLADLLPYTATAAMSLRKKAHEGLETRVAVIRPKEAERPSQERLVLVGQSLPEFSKKELAGVEINGAAPKVAVREDDTTLCRLIGAVSSRLPIAQKDVRQFIQRVAKICKIPDEALRTTMRLQEPLDFEQIREQNALATRRWVATMVDVAYIDGRMQPWERTLIQAVSEEVGFSSYDVEQVMRTRAAGWAEWSEGMRAADYFPWIVTMAAADGRFDEKEVERMRELASKCGISPSQLRQMCQAAANKTLEVTIPTDASIRLFWLVRMIDIAFADGNACIKEQRLLGKVGKKMGLSSYDIRQLIRRRRAALYKQAKEQLRGNRIDDALHLQADWGN